MKKEVRICVVITILLAVLIGLSVFLGIGAYSRRTPAIGTETASVEQELARLRESIRQLKVVKEETSLRRDIMQAQKDIRELVAALPEVPSAPSQPD